MVISYEFNIEGATGRVYEKLGIEKYIGTDAGSQYGAFYLLIYYAKSEHG